MTTVAPAVHELKTDPLMFERILTGVKTFELRKDDRGYQAGDVLVLREYDLHKPHECDDLKCSQNRWTGRALHKQIGFVAKGTFYGLALGEFAILSLLDPPDEYRGEPS